MRGRARGWWLPAVVLAVVAGVVAVGPDRVVGLVDRGPSHDVIDRLSVRADPDHPLRGELTLSASEPVTVSVEVESDDGHAFRVTPPDPASEELTVPLLGLRAERTYEVTVVLDGGDRVNAGSLETGPLPADLPPIEATSDPARMTPGLTVFDSIYRAPAEGDGERDEGFITVVDEHGEVVWFHRTELAVQDIERLASGNFAFIYNETGIREVSPTGELVREWSGRSGLGPASEDAHGRRVTTDEVIAVDTDQMHHEVEELPDGNLLTLSREIREVAYPEPVCEGEDFDGTYDVVGDTVVEFVPDTGEIVREFSMFDALDPLDNLARTRASEFCGRYLQPVYPDRLPVRDWTHANAIHHDPARNALIVSNRHTDSLDALRYEDDEHGPAGELLWRLGEEGDFELTGDGEWFLHQHAPEVQPDGTILLYDNGNERPGTSLQEPSDAPYSRAVRYRLDEGSGTAEQIWEHRFAPEELVYAPYVGDADQLAGGTVLVVHGGLLDPAAHSPVQEGAIAWGRIVEVDPETGEVVFDLTSKDPDGEVGWGIYRAERIPTIYPTGYEIEPLR